jgi:hypothetical protein
MNIVPPRLNLNFRQALASNLNFRQMDASIFICAQFLGRQKLSIFAVLAAVFCFLSRQTNASSHILLLFLLALDLIDRVNHLLDLGEVDPK